MDTHAALLAKADRQPRPTSKRQTFRQRPVSRLCSTLQRCNLFDKISLAQTHEESREKKYEIELSWICEKSGFLHQMVP